MAVTILRRMAQWYSAQCDGDWEHEFGITIETLDNPGWRVVIELEGTELDGAPFPASDVERAHDDWLVCRVRDGKFEGFCGACNLEEVLEVFLAWSQRFRSE